MEPNPASTTLGGNNEIKQEREASAQLGTTLSIDRRLSNTRPDSQPSGITVTAESRYTSEPVELPADLKALLEAWHEEEGQKKPPCKYMYRPKVWRPSKGYDREGREVILTDFVIKSPLSYGVLAARFPDNTVRLVCNYFSYHGKFGSYLKIWLDQERGFEPEPSVIRRFNEKLEDIEYQPEAWSDLAMRLKGIQQVSTAQESLPSPRSALRKRTATQSSIRAAHNKRHQPNIRDDTSSLSEAIDSSEDDEGSTGSSDDDDDAPALEAKAPQRQLQQSSRNTGPAAKPIQNPELFFKLTFFKFTVQHVRDFPLEECQTSKVLFEKARAFYTIFDRNLKVGVLSWQLASRPEQHYIFAENEGEYRSLVQQAQAVARELGKPLTIEVGLVQS